MENNNCVIASLSRYITHHGVSLWKTRGENNASEYITAPGVRVRKTRGNRINRIFDTNGFLSFKGVFFIDKN